MKAPWNYPVQDGDPSVVGFSNGCIQVLVAVAVIGLISIVWHWWGS